MSNKLKLKRNSYAAILKEYSDDQLGLDPFVICDTFNCTLDYSLVAQNMDEVTLSFEEEKDLILFTLKHL